MKPLDHLVGDGRGRAAPNVRRVRGWLAFLAPWPLNVRPEGYYGDAPRAGKAVARATKVRGPKAPRKSPAPASVDPKAVALAAMSVLGPEDQAAVLAQLGLAACPA